MARGDLPEDITGSSVPPGSGTQAVTHGITLEWENPSVARPSPLANLLAVRATPVVVIGCAGLALAMVATGSGLWTSPSRDSTAAGVFDDAMPAPVVRAMPEVAPAAQSVPEAAVARVVAPDVAPAWNVVRASYEPSRGAAARPGDLDILAATAAMPTGSVTLPAADAGEEKSEPPGPPASRGAAAVRRAAGLTSVNKARERMRNTKWTSTFFND
jgi:hypothetical protein